MASVIALALGCKGCEDEASSRPIAEPEPARSSIEQLRERVAGLGIDLTKQYPKRSDGVVECGADTTCFLVMAERCEPALLELEQNDPTQFLTRKIHARYRIEGRRNDSCAMQRLVIEATAEIPDEARKKLSDKGRSEVEINLMHAEALALLRSYFPPRMTCLFTMPHALELGLDMVEKKNFERHFPEPCDEVTDEEAWPADLAPPALEKDAAAEPSKEPAAQSPAQPTGKPAVE